MMRATVVAVAVAVVLVPWVIKFRVQGSGFRVGRENGIMALALVGRYLER